MLACAGRFAQQQDGVAENVKRGQGGDCLAVRDLSDDLDLRDESGESDAARVVSSERLV